MLLSGMVAKAQNSAGDYSAGTSALSTVGGEDCQVCAYYGEIVLRHCRRCGHRGCNLGIYRHEQRGAGRQEEDHDGRGACIFLIAAAKALPLFFGIAA